MSQRIHDLPPFDCTPPPRLPQALAARHASAARPALSSATKVHEGVCQKPSSASNRHDRPVGHLSYRKVGVSLSPEVEGWFTQKEPPAEQTMRRVLDVLLSADPRLTAYIKYGSLI